MQLLTVEVQHEKECGHPDFEWSLQPYHRDALRNGCAATLFLEWSLQLLVHDGFALRGCGHPDFGWSLQLAEHGLSLFDGAATRISGGHCNAMTKRKNVSFGAATRISGGHCNQEPARRLPPRGAATRILGGHCNSSISVTKSTPGAATLISGGHCNISSGLFSLPPVRPPGFWVVIATTYTSACRRPSVRPP